LCRVADFFGEQDTSGASAERGPLADEGLEHVEETVAGKELEECCGLAARNDEAVYVGEFFRLANEDGFRASLAQGLGMSVVIALDGQDADAWWVLYSCIQGTPSPVSIVIVDFAERDCLNGQFTSLGFASVVPVRWRPLPGPSSFR
jgi:hypothetical protein